LGYGDQHLPARTPDQVVGEGRPEATLGQKAGDPRPEHRHDCRHVVARRDSDQDRARRQGTQGPGGDRTPGRHADVEDHQVCAVLGHELGQPLARGDLAHDVEASVGGQHVDDRATHGRVIVGDDHPDGAHARRGRHAHPR
jgi:hypothetical protein